MPSQLIKILHLSDLHFGTSEQAKLWSGQLVEDLRHNLDINNLDGLILSGDIANLSTSEEYQSAQQFLDEFKRDFDLKPEQIIIVPGNHDLNWDLSKKAYTLKEKDQCNPDELQPGYHIPVGNDAVRVRNPENYSQRFKNFKTFYDNYKHNIKQYQLDSEQQYSLDIIADNILILGLNSAWQLDHHYKSRASINNNALTNALNEIRRNKSFNNCSLKIAVWHHPINSRGEDRIKDSDFLQRLAVNGFRLFLHGHVHQAENDEFRYDMNVDGRKLHRICAGTFGASTKELNTAIPWQYNLLKIEPDKVTVCTRKRESESGAWEGDFRWRHGKEQSLSYYEIQLPAFCLKGSSTDNQSTEVNEPKKVLKKVNIHWGKAPHVPHLFGRNEELNDLKQWILEDQCQVITIVGFGGLGKSTLVNSLQKAERTESEITEENSKQALPRKTKGGIGKTDLSIQLAKEIEQQFQYVYWETLKNTPKPCDYFLELVKFLSREREYELPLDLEQQIDRILDYLKQYRCLLILDNFETVLRPGSDNSQYLEEFESYGKFLEQLGTVQHQSCLLLTSREKPQELKKLAGEQKTVRFYELRGVDHQAAQEIFKTIDTKFADPQLNSQEDWQKLTFFYRGNVLFLELIARYINKQFKGKISDFLEQDGKIFEKSQQEINDWHFQHLSSREQEILYWLAINREPVSSEQLKNDIVLSDNKKKINWTIESITGKLPIEYSEMGITLQPVLIEYLTNRLIEEIVREIGTETIEIAKINLFNSFAIMKSMVAEYVRESQIRLIVQPLLDKLVDQFENQQKLAVRLKELLSKWQKEHPRKHGYLGGNILNLLCCMKVDLTGEDFSELTIWQAHLKDAILHRVNFTNADLTNSIFADHFGDIFSVAFSHQNQLLAGGGDDGLIRLWKEGDWEPYATYEGHTDFIRTLVFNHKGTKLASGGDDRTIFLWDVKTGDYIKTLELAHEGGWIQSIDFSPDDSQLVTGGGDNLVKLWNAQTLELIKIFPGHQGGIMTVCFSPDGKTIASGGRDGMIILWDVKTGCKIFSSSKLEDRNWIYSLAFSYDGRILASAERDHTVRLWDVESCQPVGILREHKDQVWSVCFSPDNKKLASGGDDGRVIIWDINTNQIHHSLTGHQGSVGQVSFNADSSILASCGSDAKIRLWDIASGQCMKVLYGRSSPVFSLAYNPDGKTIASGGKTPDGKNFAVILWDLETRSVLHILPDHTSWILTVAFSPDGKVLASGSEDHTVKLWNLQDLDQPPKDIKGHDCRIETVTFSPNGKILASAGHDCRICLWDVSSKIWQKGGKPQLLGILEESDRVFSVKFNSQGTLLASGGADGKPKLWHITPNRNSTNPSKILEGANGHTDQVWTVAFSPDDNLLATGSDDCLIKLWDVETGSFIRDLQGHEDWIWSVAFHPDGNLLASASGDYTVKIWDIETGACLETLEHSNWVWRVAFSPDKMNLASASSDETVKIWDIQDIKPGTTVTKRDRCIKTLATEKPYQDMIITPGTKGLTQGEITALKALGAKWSKKGS